MIPAQLHDFRFIRVLPRSKRPMGKRWPDHGFPLDSPVIKQWVQMGGNYGVLGSKTKFIIDIDVPELQDYMKDKLPDTFIVQTGSLVGRHYYFMGSCEKNYKFYDPYFVEHKDMRKAMNKHLRGFVARENAGEELSEEEIKAKGQIQDSLKSWGEVQITGRMVVGPGSIHPSGNPYTVLQDLPIATLDDQTIRQVFKPYILRAEAPPKRIRSYPKNKFSQNHDSDYHIAIDQVASTAGMQHMGGGEYQGPHPVHGSTTGMNFTMNTQKDVWFCFRCSSGGNALHLVAIEEGLLDCVDCVPGALQGELFRRVLEAARTRKLIEVSPKRVNKNMPEKVDIGTLKQLGLQAGMPPCFQVCALNYLKNYAIKYPIEQGIELTCKELKTYKGVCIKQY